MRIKNTLTEVAEGTYKRILDPSFAGGAAEVTFWLILSMVPATILLAQVLHIFTLSMEAAEHLLGVYVSAEVYDIIAPLLEYSPKKGTTILLIILALWAGSSAVFSLMRIINRAYGVVPKSNNTIAEYFMGRLRAMLMTVLILATMIFALYILVFGELIVNTALSYNNDFLGYNYTFSEVWFGVRWIIAFVLFFITVFSIYYVLPRSGVIYREYFGNSKLATVKNVLAVWLKNRRLEYLRALPGSLFTATIMLVVTGVYSVFVSDIASYNFNILYGGLSSIIVLLIWFYAISFILLTGVQVNAAYAEYASNRKKEE